LDITLATGYLMNQSSSCGWVIPFTTGVHHCGKHCAALVDGVIEATPVAVQAEPVFTWPASLIPASHSDALVPSPGDGNDWCSVQVSTLP
jgi:hypothetical protein